MGSLTWFVVMTQSEEGADGLSDVEWSVASMDGVDAWLRWLASKVAWNGGVDGWRRWWTGVFDTESTDVEVPLCPQW